MCSLPPGEGEFEEILRLTRISVAWPHSYLWTPKTTLLYLETIHNRCDGTILTLDYTEEVCNLADTRVKGTSGSEITLA